MSNEVHELNLKSIVLFNVVNPPLYSVRAVKYQMLMMLNFLPGLATTAGQCKAGYYCAGRADRQDPTDGTTGNICPPGRYCG